MSLFLKESSRFIVQIMLLISFLVVLRGHNYPGGGFIGGLIGSAAIALYVISFDIKAQQFTKFVPWMNALALIFLLVSIAASQFNNASPLAGVWWQYKIFKQIIKFGTPIIFDFGIYFLVLGSVSWILAVLEDSKS